MGTKDKAVRIFFTGVGGQGTLLATRFVGEAALQEGLPVLMSEIHGMAQRGGVVESSVVMGNAFSPTIADGEADIVVAFEPLEAARALPKCSPLSMVITGTTPVPPFTVTVGQSTYPDVKKLLKMIGEKVRRLITVDADALARSANAERSSNVAMIGVLAGTGLLPISKESWGRALTVILPGKLLEQNVRAFESGFVFGEQSA
ncbi:MAG: indolepyruvate oxidoreductase subunit beta [Syntrophobacter sp.]